MSHHGSEDKIPRKLPRKHKGTTGAGTAVFPPPAQLTGASTLNEVLAFARKQSASDVHLTCDQPIIFRQFGQLKKITTEPMTAKHIRELLAADLPGEVIEDFTKTGDLEYVHSIPGYGRFRMTLIKQRLGCDLTARIIPTQIPKFEDTGMPESCKKLTKWAQGLILIAGPTGCGKTTTLATLVEMLNQHRPEHVITIEEPIEIVFEPKKCQVTQREINTHTTSQNNALRAALREDPDILVVGELRDLSTIQLAISASETGHLVLGTMNTVNAVQTISRVVDSFPADEQPIIRKMISESLRGIICQQMVPHKDGNGMAVAYEVLIINQPAANLIREDKFTQIKNVMATGKSHGMVLMDSSLEALANAGVISTEEACARATDPDAMLQAIAH